MEQATVNLIAAADRGEIDSAFNVAMQHKDGTREIRIDLILYAHYIKMVADSKPTTAREAEKVALSALLVARGYQHGNEGFSRDDNRARLYYLRAAVGANGEGSGHPLAARLVGEWLIEGQQGFPRDPQRGWRLMLSAADKNDGPAMMFVAKGYLYGTYCEASEERAGQYLYHYIMRARNEKELHAFTEYNKLERESIQLYTSVILKNEPKNCIDFLNRLPENFGAPFMQAALTGWYYIRMGAYEVALQFVRKGLKCNDSSCTGCMGLMYVFGLGVQADLSEARFYWEVGADGGDANCKNALAHFKDYSKKPLTPKDFQKCLQQLSIHRV